MGLSRAEHAASPSPGAALHSGRLYHNEARDFYRPGGPCDSTRPPSPEVIKQRVAPYGVPVQQLPQKTLGAQMLG